MTFVKNGDTLPPLLTDDERWQRLILEDPTRSIAIMMDDQLKYYNSETDTVNSIITFHIGRDSLRKSYPFDYSKTSGDLTLNGVLESDTLTMDLKTYDMSNFYLIDRGFNWVNEVPWYRYNPRPKPNW